MGPEMTFSETDIAPGLIGAHVKQITEYVGYWLGRLSSTSKSKQMVTATSRLVAGYRFRASPDYRYSYAQKMAALSIRSLAALGKSEDPLTSAREIQLAIALTQMPKVTIQPAVTVLVTHSNPGVRYIGWNAYRNAALVGLILAQGADYTKPMYDSIERAAAAETDGNVLGQVFGALILPSAAELEVSASQLAEGQRRAAAILRKVWPARCLQVRLGSAPVAHAFRHAVDALAAAAAEETDKAKLTAWLQMAVDVSYCSALAYSQAIEGGQRDVELANMLLLRRCEALLKALTRVADSSISKALSDRNRGLRGSGTRYAVQKRIDLLKPRGIVSPKKQFKNPPAGATTAPSSKPATRAADK